MQPTREIQAQPAARRFRVTLPEMNKMRALIAARRLQAQLHTREACRPHLDGQRSGENVRHDGRVYFEINFADEQELRKYARGLGADVEETPTFNPIDECLNCGNIADELVTVCPNCAFREISACPLCRAETPRLRYLEVAENMHQCPNCHQLVRLSFNEPLWLPDGHYNQPVVVVTPAGE